MLRYLKTSLLAPLEANGLFLMGFILILTLFGAGSVYAKCPVGDLNRDCRVDLLDMQLFAQMWLAPSECSADLDGDFRVDMDDFALLTQQWHREGIPLTINEFMAANNAFQDPQGQFDDWIEIYNYGEDAINVGDMYLTDNLTAATKWQIPGNNPTATTIGPGGYLLIWADNDTTDAGLHAGFKLDADGEEIGLFNSDGVTLIDSIIFPDQTVDVSFGRYPDANDDLRFFGSPSPGAENNGAFLGEVADTKFSHDRGLYDTPFSLTIATETEGALIYYTLDGTEPYLLGGRFPTGTVYTGPISINKTTCLRAKAIKQGWKFSGIDTQTYIFLDDIIHQSAYPYGFPNSWGGTSADYEMDPDIVNNPFYRSGLKDDLKSIPTMSLVIKTEDLFDSDKGIYANQNSQGFSW